MHLVSPASKVLHKTTTRIEILNDAMRYYLEPSSSDWIKVKGKLSLEEDLEDP
jgi:hypothetical protein